MSRTLSIACCCALFCAAALPGWPSNVRGQSASVKGGVFPDLRLAGDSIPAPPQQSTPWEVSDTKLSKEFVSATAKLFQQGLADPRGCEYREIEVIVGGFEPPAFGPPWADEIRKTHGWVIPGNQPQRFGVCWNGLVYPLGLVGKAADVRADASAAIQGEVASALRGTGRIWYAYFEDSCLCHPWEGRAVSHDSPLPVKACLLLRLGEADLAERLWNRWASGLRASLVNKPYLEDPYLALANCWTLSLFDRAVAAHLRGDDRLALASADLLASVWRGAEAEAAKRGFERPSPEKARQGEPYFLLDAHRASELLADQRRRAKDRSQHTGPLLHAGEYAHPGKFAARLRERLGQCPDGAHRIALLIRQLEEEANWQYDLYPVPELLREEGDAAVEPLLACLERDNRLTRRPPLVEPYPVGVHTIAEPILEQILNMPFSMLLADHDGLASDESANLRACAPRIREYWKRYGGVALPERWYRILADDHADPRHWFAAAAAIVQPASIPVTVDTVAYGWEQSCWDVNDKGKMHGEALRNKTNPSVTELMAKRVKALNQRYYELLPKHRELKEQQERLEERQRKLEKHPDELNERRREELEKQQDELSKQQDELDQRQSDWWKSHRDGYDMVLYLAQWDPGAALPLLREQTNLYRLAWAEDLGVGSAELVQLFVARVKAGDRKALDEYAKWLSQVFGRGADSPKDLDTLEQPWYGLEQPWYGLEQPWFPREHDWFPASVGGEAILEPVWRYPKVPAIADVAEWLLNAEDSPCHPLIRLAKDAARDDAPERVLCGPLVVSPAFRKQLLRMLEDKGQAGVYEVQSDRQAGEKPNGRNEVTLPPDPLRPPQGTKVPYRVCDLCAHHLSALDGTSKCELFWPEKERDRAVAACSSFLRQYGHHFRLDEEILDADGLPLRSLPGDWSWDAPSFHLAFSPLDHPATPEDVRKGDAIFSLSGLGRVRLARVPNLPHRVSWPALKDYPSLGEVHGPHEESKKAVGYEQEGTVWQAEELEVGGRWQRYYGFVGRHGLAKVPAEEIVFQAEEIRSAADAIAFQTEEEWIALDGQLFVGLKAAPDAKERNFVNRGDDDRFRPPMLFYRAGQPMVFQVRACNRSGTDRPLPFLAENVGGQAPVGSIPMSLQLDYRPGDPPVRYELCLAGRVAMYSLVGVSWTRLPRKRGERLIADRNAGMLTPAEYGDCLHLDLNRLFDVSRPGTYRLSLKLASGKNGAWQENEIAFAVIEKSDKPAASVRQAENQR